MRRSWALAVALGASACWLLLAGWAPGLATAADEAFRLEYQAPDGCPDRARFVEEVRSRLKRGRLTESAELARTFRIGVTTSAERSVARMDFVDSDGQRAERVVSGATCDEAVRAVALVAALAIDARAAEEPAPAPTAPAPTTSAPEPKPPAPRPSAPPPPAPQPAPVPVLRRAAPPSVGAGAQAGVLGGFAPELAPRIAAFVEAAPPDGLLTARLAFGFADSGPVAIDDGRARFRLYTARFDACALAFEAGRWLELRPCAGLDAGLVHAAGEESARIVAPQSTTLPWFAAVATLRLELFVDPRLFLELEGNLIAPLSRHEFVLERPEVVVHAVPSLTGGASLGVGVRF